MDFYIDFSAVQLVRSPEKGNLYIYVLNVLSLNDSREKICRGSFECENDYE